MKIKFLVDYRGVHTRSGTQELYFQAGNVADLPEAQALALIDEGRAVKVSVQKPARSKKS